MCTSAGSGGGDVRENAPATPPIAPPACLLASFSCWGLWWGLEASVGVGGGPEGRQGGGSAGALLVLVLPLLPSFCCFTCSCSPQDVPLRCL